MGKHIDSLLKDQILEAVKNGSKVADICVQHGVSSKTVYAWLRHQADNTGTSSLEVARLRRENQELKEIIGIFALQKKRAEKNQRSA